MDFAALFQRMKDVVSPQTFDEDEEMKKILADKSNVRIPTGFKKEAAPTKDVKVVSPKPEVLESQQEAMLRNRYEYQQPFQVLDHLHQPFNISDKPKGIPESMDTFQNQMALDKLSQPNAAPPDLALSTQEPSPATELEGQTPKDIYDIMKTKYSTAVAKRQAFEKETFGHTAYPPSVSVSQAVRPFLRGMIPHAIIPGAPATIDAIGNLTDKVSGATGIPPDKIIEMSGGLAGMVYGFSTIYKGCEFARAWMVGKDVITTAMEPISALSSLSKIYDTGIAGKMGSAAATFAAYEVGQGNVKTPKELTRAATVGASFEGAMAMAPVAFAAGVKGGGAALQEPKAILKTITDAYTSKIGKPLWDKIVSAYEKGAVAINTTKVINPKYGTNLLELTQPASVRLAKNPALAPVLETVKDLQSYKYLVEKKVEERTATSALSIKQNVPGGKGQQLLTQLMQLDPADHEFWVGMKKIEKTLGRKAADTLLKERMISRADWIEVGKEAVKTPWTSRQVEGEKLFRIRKTSPGTVDPMPWPVGKAKKPMAQYVGYAEDNGLYYPQFSIKGLDGKITEATTRTHDEFLAFKKGHDVLNFPTMHTKGGKWTPEITEVDQMLLKESTRVKNLETYFPRIFQKHWDELPLDLQSKYAHFKSKGLTPFARQEAINMLGASAARFLKKNNLPQELVDALEPLIDACVIDYQGLVSAGTAIRTARAFDSISRNANACMTTPEKNAYFASGNADPSKWIQVPNNPNRYFKLAGKWLHRDVFMELESMVLPAENASSLAHQALGKWKGWKTIWSPRQHVRNTCSNIIMNATLGEHGMPFWGDGWKAYRQMANILKNPKTPENATILTEMAKNNLLIGTFRQADLASIAPATESEVTNMFDYMGRGLSHVRSKAARAYEAEERWAKGAKYLYETRTLGIDPATAAKDAMDSTFNYTDLPLAVKKFKEAWWGAPFATFTYKAVPMLMESAIKYPWRIAAVETAIYGFNATAINSLGLTDKENEDIQRKVPSYVANGHYVPMPFRDAKNRIQFFDASYLLPWGVLTNVVQQYTDTRQIPLVGTVVLTNPLFAAGAMVVSNKRYNQSDIRKPYVTPLENTLSTLGALWEQAVPAIMIGGTDFNSVVDTVRKSKSPKTLTWGQQIAKQFGPAIFPRDETELNRSLMGKYLRGKEEIESEARQTIREGGNRNKAIQRARDRMKRLMDEVKGTP